jgi:plastocyanin
MEDVMTTSNGKGIIRPLIALLIALSLGAFACGSEESSGGGSSETVDVTASDFQFDTNKIEVDPGKTVEVALTNDGEAEHSFSVEELDVEIEAEGGESATGDLDAPDEDVTYEFFCKYHPEQMRGELIVGSGGAAPGGGGGGMYESPDEGESPYEGESPHEDESDGGSEDDGQGGYDY